MLLQTNSYIVPKDKRSEHARLLRKFRATLQRLGADQLEVYEQVGANWAAGEATGRFVQIMRFRDRKHQQAVHAAERQDPAAQQLIQEFCALINFPYQQQQGLFAVGYYTSAIPVAGARVESRTPQAQTGSARPAAAAAGAAATTSEAATGELLDSPEPVAPAEEQGSSLLDFSALVPSAAAEDRPPMRLTSDVDDSASDVLEAELEPAGTDAPVGEGTFSDAPEAMLDLVHSEADDDTLSDTDREAILGELTGDDAAEQGGRQKAEG